MHPDDLDQAARADLTREFRLRGVLGGGGWGSVYEAFDARSGRRVAVRVIARQPLADAGLLESVERAIAAGSALDHPNVVPIYRAGASARLPWYAMELLEGRTLAPAPPPPAARQSPPRARSRRIRAGRPVLSNGGGLAPAWGPGAPAAPRRGTS